MSTLHSIRQHAATSLRTHGILIGLVVCYVGALPIVAAQLELSDHVTLNLYSSLVRLMTASCLILFVILRGLYILLVVRPERPLREAWVEIKSTWLTPERILTALPVLVFLPWFMSAHAVFKSMIPCVNPYSWDPAFRDLDAVLHGSVQPWEVLHPVLGYPLVTCGVNFVYNFWLFAVFLVLFWQAFSLENLRLRMQFFLAFVLSWVLLGTFAAMAFSSVGPCYYSRLFEPDASFEQLMGYLRAAGESCPVWALGTQDMLWESYEKASVHMGSGISAMPSMHVAMAVLFALLGWRTGKAWGIGWTVFALFILLGSVHLGWHYAVDGYVSMVATWLIWWGCGWVSKRCVPLRGTSEAAGPADPTGSGVTH